MDYLNNLYDSERLLEVVEEAADYAYCLGMILRPSFKTPTPEVATHAPFTIVPSPVPRELFNQAVNAQKDFNSLMFKISCNRKFMNDALGSVVNVDQYTSKLFEIYEKTFKKRDETALQMAILRADYMFEDTRQLKQVEINMISAGAIVYGDKIRKIHCNILRRNNSVDGIKIPKNPAKYNIAKFLTRAWEKYGNAFAVIVFVVCEGERNIFGQRHLEQAVFKVEPRVVVKRLTLTQIYHKYQITSENALVVDGTEVAVVYYRAGYVPDHYPTEIEWKAREVMDRSNAINCPSVGLQLVGTKKMQQVLAIPGNVERFIDDKEAVKRIRDTFVGFYHLEMNEEGDRNVKMAMKNPKNFVMKPQLEGGGNNLFRDDIVKKLEEIGKDDRRCAYILMKKICPMKFPTAIVSERKLTSIDGVSELGIFGCFLGNMTGQITNEVCGHSLKTKSAGNDHSTLMVGDAVTDSPLLY